MICNLKSLQSESFLTGAGLQRQHTWYQNPSTFTLVQLHKQSRAVCCGGPWPASLHHSFLSKGRAIWSQHNTKKARRIQARKQRFRFFWNTHGECFTFLSCFIWWTQRYFRYPCCLCSSMHNPIVSICYIKGGHFSLLSFSSLLFPSTKCKEACPTAWGNKSCTSQEKAQLGEHVHKLPHTVTPGCFCSGGMQILPVYLLILYHESRFHPP